MRRSAAALLVVAALTACGGGGSPSGPALTRSQLVTKVNAQCAMLTKASDDLAQAQDPNSKGSKVHKFMNAAASVLRARVHAIQNLNPPASLSSQMTKFTSLLNRYADGLDSLASGIQSDETFDELLARSTSQVTALNNLSQQTNTIAAGIGFNACST